MCDQMTHIYPISPKGSFIFVHIEFPKLLYPTSWLCNVLFVQTGRTQDNFLKKLHFRLKVVFHKNVVTNFKIG